MTGFYMIGTSVAKELIIFLVYKESHSLYLYDNGLFKKIERIFLRRPNYNPFSCIYCIYFALL